MATTISGSSNSSFGGTIDSTGIDDNATSTAITIDSAEHVSLAHGIGFNGDTAAANALDDYEEGTWTATLTPSTSGSFTSYYLNQRRYTKIGDTVNVTVRILVNDGGASSPVGTYVKLSLPFTCNSSASGTAMALGNGTPINLASRVNTSGTEAFIYVDASTVTWGGTGNDIFFEATYQVA